MFNPFMDSYKETTSENSIDFKNYKNDYLQLCIPEKLKKQLLKKDLPYDRFYKTHYDSTGRFKLVYNSSGYHSVLDTVENKQVYEHDATDQIYNGTFLHTEEYVAFAQSKAVYIYKNGAELQCIRHMKGTASLHFLPYHFLLLALNFDGTLKYFDTSIGKVVSSLDPADYMSNRTEIDNDLKDQKDLKSDSYIQRNNTSSNMTFITNHKRNNTQKPKKVFEYFHSKKQFRSKMPVKTHPVFCVNPRNAIAYLGHSNGVITTHQPTQKEFLSKIICHKSAIKNIQIDKTGTYLLTTGLDHSLKVFDIRQTYAPVIDLPIKNNFDLLRLSDNNSVAVSYKNEVYICNDFIKNATQNHDFNQIITIQENFGTSLVTNLEFCPFQDIISVGTTRGFKSLIAPHTGDPIFVSRLETPYRTIKQRNELEVKRLLEKVPFDLISENNDILGTLN